MRARVLLGALLALALAAPARADVFGPPSGQVLTGVSGSLSTSPFSSQVGKHPAVFGFFTYWYSHNQYAFDAARAGIDAKLAALHLPPVRGRDGGEELPEPQVAMLWVPQTEGSPAIARNSAAAYWPGSRYVDWVGTDFYSRFPAFSKLETFYREFKKPFVFGEWALWGGDSPGFVQQLFSFVNSHRRVRMMLYNQGNDPDGPFRLKRYPRSKAAIRHALHSSRFLASAG